MTIQDEIVLKLTEMERRLDDLVLPEVGTGTAISGSGIAGQVTYWTAPAIIAGDPGFTYNAGTDTATLAGGFTLTGGANAVVTVNDNVANAMTLVDAGATEYLRIISTDAQPIVRWNDGGADIDYYVEAVGVADALFIRGSDGQCTIGALGTGYAYATAGVLSIVDPIPLTDLGSYAQGRIIYGGAVDWTTLAHPGAANRVLQSTAAEVAWSANAVTFPAAGAVPVGTGANTQVTYWTGANTIAGDAGFTYNAGTNTLTVGAIDVSSGGDIDPADATGMDLGDATHLWDLYTREVYFGGATGTNIIQVPDNVADALHISDAGALEYLRIISTNTQPIVRWNDGGADIDYYVEAVGVADALFIRGNDGQFTVGVLGAGFVQSTAGGVLSSAAIAAGDLPAHTHSGAGQGGSLVVGTTDTDATAGSVFFAGVAGVIQEDNANFFWDDGNNRLGIGTNVIPHGGVGAAMLALEGANANVAGPHVQFTTASDNYPLIQIRPWQHDNINIVFDAYYDGAWKSSDAGTNALLTKGSDTFYIAYDSGVAQGGAVTWNTALLVDLTTGDVAIGTTDTSSGILTIQEPDAGTNANSSFFTQDGDGTDYNSIIIYGVGTPGAIANRERLVIQWDKANSYYKIQSEADGTGTLRPLEIETEGNTGQIYLHTGGGVAIGGVITPDGTLHAHTATAGVVTANAGADDLIVENSSAGGISILVPDSSNANIYFGSPTDDVGAYIRWNHDADLMTVGTANAGAELSLISANGVEAVRIDSNQNFAVVAGYSELGPDAAASEDGEIAQASGSFAAAGDAQRRVFNARRSVTHSDANWYNLFIDGAADRMNIPADTAWTFNARIIGTTQGGGAGMDVFSYIINGCIENDNGTTTLNASTTTTVYEDDADFDARALADDANDALLIQVQDSTAGGATVRWETTVAVSQVIYP